MAESVSSYMRGYRESLHKKECMTHAYVHVNTVKISATRSYMRAVDSCRHASPRIPKAFTKSWSNTMATSKVRGQPLDAA